MNIRWLVCAAAGLVVLTPSFVESVGTESWIEIKVPSTQISVVTNAGEKAGRRVAFQAAQFDRSLFKRFAWLKRDDTPLVVVASPDEVTVRLLASDAVDADKDNGLSSYFIGSTHHFGALRTDLPDPGDKERSPARGFYRGRAAYLVERSLGKSAPAWLSRGLVTFLADALVRDKEILLGRLTAADGATAPLQAPPSAEFFRDVHPIDRTFDLQAGLFVHYLLTADGGKGAGAMDELSAALASNNVAATQAAAAKVALLYPGFPKYLTSRKFAPLKLPLDPGVAPAAFEVRPVTDADALMRRAEVLFEMNRPVDTRGLLRLAKAADPTLARPLEIEAILYEREQRTAESRQAIESAIQLGSKNGSLYYRLAQLQWSRSMTKAALEGVQKLLEKSVELSPSDPEASAYLAEIQGDLGLFDAALPNAERAAARAPQDVYAQMALARARWNAKQVDVSLATAKQSLTLAKGVSQKQRVQDFLNFANANKVAQAKGAKPYPGQFGPPPPGAFGVTRAVMGPAASRVLAGGARTDSGDASAIADCFTKRDDAACSRAVPALEASCADKQGASCVSMGSLYDGGFGVTRDRRKAAANYKTACDLDEKAGCARLAVLEAQGVGIPKNASHATKTLEGLCGEHVAEGCVGLAQILQQTGYATDRARARDLLKSACDGGNAEACRLMTAR